MTTLFRWIFSIALLIVVWRHSHWSVALCLTLNLAAMEGLIAIFKKKKLLP